MEFKYLPFLSTFNRLLILIILKGLLWLQALKNLKSFFAFNNLFLLRLIIENLLILSIFNNLLLENSYHWVSRFLSKQETSNSFFTFKNGLFLPNFDNFLLLISLANLLLMPILNNFLSDFKSFMNFLNINGPLVLNLAMFFLVLSLGILSFLLMIIVFPVLTFRFPRNPLLLLGLTVVVLLLDSFFVSCS